MKRYISIHQDVFAEDLYLKICTELYKLLSHIFIIFVLCTASVFTVHFHYLWFSLTHGQRHFKVGEVVRAPFFFSVCLFVNHLSELKDGSSFSRHSEVRQE